MCRASANDCDIAENCDGLSPLCPPDDITDPEYGCEVVLRDGETVIIPPVEITALPGTLADDVTITVRRVTTPPDIPSGFIPVETGVDIEVKEQSSLVLPLHIKYYYNGTVLETDENTGIVLNVLHYDNERGYEPVTILGHDRVEKYVLFEGREFSKHFIGKIDFTTLPSTWPTPGRNCCGSQCINPLWDVQNCGQCGAECLENEECESGTCECSYGFVCDGECVNYGDPNHCGRCGMICPLGERRCEWDRCVPCDHWYDTECDGECVDTETDSNNCGACGHACVIGEVCVSGTCVTGECDLSCPNGRICCDGQCINPLSDVQNCGRCGAGCLEEQECYYGTCECWSGFVCNGECVNYYDPNNCGGCDVVCPLGERRCDGDTCIPCDYYGYNTECDGECVDTETDSNNCGACGHACVLGGVCVSGVCVYGESSDTDTEIDSDTLTQ